MSNDVAYLGVLNGRGLGDTLGMLSFDLRAQRNAEHLYWIVHAKGLWINFELFRLYHRAGIFRNLVYVDGVDSGNYADPAFYPRYLEYFEIAFGREHRVVSPIAGLPEYMPEEVRRHFSFLGPFGLAYVTFQPCSVGYASGALVDPRGSVFRKRMSYPQARTHLEHLRPDRLLVLGTRQDAPVVARYLPLLARDFPEMNIEDLSGKTSLEGYFRVLYGASAHLSCESGSAFFTSQVGIRTIQVYNEVWSRDNFANYFREIPTLRLIVDEHDVFNDDSDLRGEKI